MTTEGSSDRPHEAPTIAARSPVQPAGGGSGGGSGGGDLTQELLASD